MMLLFRIASLVVLGYGLVEVTRNAAADPHGGDLVNAFWLAYCLIVGIVAALLWAPLIAEHVADPITGVLTTVAPVGYPNHLMKLIRWLEAREARRWVRWLCFVEGVRHPWNPAPFVTGMDHARPGSWLERVYAREVYQFNHAQHCLRAYAILCQHGHPPRLHPNTEVNLLIAALQKSAAPDRKPLPIPPSTSQPLKRIPGIGLPAGLSPIPPPPTRNPAAPED